MLKRNWGLIAVVVGAVLVAGYVLAMRIFARYQRIHAVTAVPVDVEVAQGTDVVFRRTQVGRVDSLGAARWGLETAYRLHDALGLWRPATLLGRSTAGAGSAPAVLLELDQTALEIVLTVRQGATALRLGRRDGGWVDSTSPSRSAVSVNGKRLKPGDQALHLLPGDYLGLEGIDLRIGRFLRVTPVYLTFTTSKLCPLRGLAKGLPWHPNASEQAACASRTVRGAAQLSLNESFGLTKPVFKLTPSEGEAAIVSADQRSADSLWIPMAPRTDLQAGIEQMVAYLNAPVASRPEPNTHFEYTVSNADSMVRSITIAARNLSATAGTINTALRSPDGLAPAVLGTGSSEFLRQTLANTAGLTGRLADPSGTLVQNVGLEPAVSNATRTIARADTTMDQVRAQVLRLTPRVELAADQVTNSMESVQGTLQSVKTAAQDITGLANGLTSPTARKVGLGSVGVIALASLVSLLAHLKYIF
jgi:hypothetical protein